MLNILFDEKDIIIKKDEDVLDTWFSSALIPIFLNKIFSARIGKIKRETRMAVMTPRRISTSRSSAFCREGLFETRMTITVTAPII